MVSGIWGKKIGMTQVFANDKVVPATAIDCQDWFVTNIKTKERDGYDAIQVGLVRSRYVDQKFNVDWIKKPRTFFSFVREIPLKESMAEFSVGTRVSFSKIITLGEKVDVFGKTIGRGFAGVVRRHGFTGGAASHGSMMGDRPGSVGHLRTSGMVIKGKRLPGHMGTAKRVMRKLEVVMMEESTNTLLVKGSIPGKSGSLVFIRRA